jgi:hypothetical protein
MASSTTALRIGTFSFLFALASNARAAAPWVDRAITLPRRAWAFNFGLGVARVPDGMGPGLNLEAAASVAHGVEIGLRTGFRFGGPARAGKADVYGRPFETETYGTGSDVVANPEFHLRVRLIESEVVEVGIEGRVYTPFSDGLGVMPAIPLAFHFGRAARLDTGVYVPILFYDPTYALISFPFHLWFQATNRLWLGPLSGVRVESSGGNRTQVPLGFGLGYAVTGSVDFKTQFLFQDVSHGSSPRGIYGSSTGWWGFGAGLEVRID